MQGWFLNGFSGFLAELGLLFCLLLASSFAVYEMILLHFRKEPSITVGELQDSKVTMMRKKKEKEGQKIFKYH